MFVNRPKAGRGAFGLEDQRASNGEEKDREARGTHNRIVQYKMNAPVRWLYIHSLNTWSMEQEKKLWGEVRSGLYTKHTWPSWAR